METGPVEDVFPIEHGRFSIAMLVYSRVGGSTIWQMKIQWWFNQNWPILEHDGSTKHVMLENWNKCIHFQPKKKTEDKIEIEDTQQHFHNFFEDWLLSWWRFDDLRHMRMLENEPEQRWNRMVEAWSWIMMLDDAPPLVVSFELFSSWWFFTQPIYKNMLKKSPNWVSSSSPKVEGPQMRTFQHQGSRFAAMTDVLRTKDELPTYQRSSWKLPLPKMDT